MTHLYHWLNTHYLRLMDVTMFFGFIGIGLAMAYAPPADSMAFVQRVFIDIDRTVLAWMFFILPSPIFLLRERWLWKFAGLAPFGFMLGALSWFLLTTPNRSWFVAPVFALTLIRMSIHYVRLILNDLRSLNGHTN